MTIAPLCTAFQAERDDAIVNHYCMSNFVLIGNFNYLPDYEIFTSLDIDVCQPDWLGSGLA